MTEDNSEMPNTSEDNNSEEESIEPSKTEYPTGDNVIGKVGAEEDLMGDLTMDELKEAFRLFDEDGEGFITTARFRVILKEVDEEFSEDELDEIIATIDLDCSGTIDFEEFVKIMT